MTGIAARLRNGESSLSLFAEEWYNNFSEGIIIAGGGAVGAGLKGASFLARMAAAFGTSAVGTVGHEVSSELASAAWGARAPRLELTDILKNAGENGSWAAASLVFAGVLGGGKGIDALKAGWSPIDVRTLSSTSPVIGAGGELASAIPRAYSLTVRGGRRGIAGGMAGRSRIRQSGQADLSFLEMIRHLSGHTVISKQRFNQMLDVAFRKAAADTARLLSGAKGPAEDLLVFSQPQAGSNFSGGGVYMRKGVSAVAGDVAAGRLRPPIVRVLSLDGKRLSIESSRSAIANILSKRPPRSWEFRPALGSWRNVARRGQPQIFKGQHDAEKLARRMISGLRGPTGRLPELIDDALSAPGKRLARDAVGLDGSKVIRFGRGNAEIWLPGSQ